MALCLAKHRDNFIRLLKSSESLVSYNFTTLRRNLEDHDLNLHWHENFKSSNN